MSIGEWHYLRVNVDDMSVDELTPAHYLAFKEKLLGNKEFTSAGLVDGNGYSPFVLEIDMRPFNEGLPRDRKSVV